MNPLSVLLIHRTSDVYRHLTGWWSYPVDEFNWFALKVENGFSVNLNTMNRHFDFVVLDDWIFGQVRNLTTPMAYVVVDSARSDAQLARNLEQARQANLVLVDSDDLSKFNHSECPARRFAYAVNEQLFFPREKVYDMAFLCWPTPERRIIQHQIEDICKRRGWSFITGTYDWPDYARFLSSAKVVIHQPHIKAARSWRVFDTMAARGCLLTAPIPLVSGDGIVSGVHYREYTNEGTLEAQLIDLLDNSQWKDIATAGYEHIMEHHTWRSRAKELRGIVNEVWGC